MKLASRLRTVESMADMRTCCMKMAGFGCEPFGRRLTLMPGWGM